MIRSGPSILFAVLSGCMCQPPTLPLPDGGADAGFDAGAADAGTPPDAGARDCLEALPADAGAACTFSDAVLCEAADFCCTQFAWCAAGWKVGGQKTCRTADLITSCAPIDGGTFISGNTPLGAVSFFTGWGSASFGFDHNLILQFADTATAQACADRALGVDTDIEAHDAGWDSVAQFRTDGGLRFGSAHVRLVTIDHSHAAGTLTITSPGWSVSGSFDVPVCAELDRSGP
jgi:hypothetical protein